jgi:hypothetical protein
VGSGPDLLGLYPGHMEDRATPIETTYQIPPTRESARPNGALIYELKTGTMHVSLDSRWELCQGVTQSRT